MEKTYIVIGIICLLLIICILCKYIYGLKKEIRQFDKWIQKGEHIYYVDLYDKDIESLAYSINQRIQTEEKKERTVERQDRNFKKLVANLSHDLRTPITVISGYLQLLKLENNINNQAKEYITHLEKKTNYLKNLVDDLYMLFWSEAIEKEIEMLPVDVTELSISILKEYIENSQRAAEMFDIKMPKHSILIIGNKRVITRILCNLIDNALKYSTKSISFVITEDQRFCYIKISNPAEFMQDENIDSIFDLFYTKDATNTSSNGMGLYTTKKLVKNLGGNIYANYEKNIFSIEIELIKDKSGINTI